MTSIRRKSTAHDLATLRLHPDGSRVQQSSVNARHRRAKSTIVDSRGNWIAKDAGGKSSVKTRRVVSVHPDDAECEYIDISGDEYALNGSKGKEPACDGQDGGAREPEPEHLDARTRQRLSFMNDLSFLDSPPVAVSSLGQGSDGAISFLDPAPDLLKSIHHFASCYYRERGQLFDSSKDYRRKKKEKYKQSQENIRTFTTGSLEHEHGANSETKGTETEDESTEEDEENSAIVEVEDSGTEEANTKPSVYREDMYRAFDGSALMAIGIVLQEYVAHTLASNPRNPED